MSQIQVLDRGFVRLVDSMGSDLSVVNAARVSMGKHKDTFDAADAKLINYLAEHEHTSPFRHATVQLHIKAPIFVFRQLMKHQVGCSWNEISGRYVEFAENEYYCPAVFRQQSKINKQGSSGHIPEELQHRALELYTEVCDTCVTNYKRLLELGIAREQARGVLPVGMYSEAILTASLQAIAHLIRLRTESHAQWEAQEYGRAIKSIVEPMFPASLAALLETQ